MHATQGCHDLGIGVQTRQLVEMMFGNSIQLQPCRLVTFEHGEADATTEWIDCIRLASIARLTA